LRLLLRRNHAAPTYGSRSSRDREADEAHRESEPWLPARDDFESRGDSRFQRTRRAAQVRTDRRKSRRTSQRLLHRRLAVHRLLPRSARAKYEQAARIQTAVARRRLLERRCRATADAAHLRHGILLAGRTRRLAQTARRS